MRGFFTIIQIAHGHAVMADNPLQFHEITTTEKAFTEENLLINKSSFLFFLVVKGAANIFEG